MESIIHNDSHDVEVINKNSVTCTRRILIKITRSQLSLLMKLHDLDDFSFNYTAEMDWGTFEKMKVEQCLEISYDEFHLHLVDLLKRTTTKELLLKLDVSTSQCKLVICEKSRIKLLVFLIVELTPTDLVEVINEMAGNIMHLKEANKIVHVQMVGLKCQLQEKDGALSAALVANNNFKAQFRKSLEAIDDMFGTTVHSIERDICTRIDKLNRRHVNLSLDLEAIKQKSNLKGVAFIHTLRQLEQARVEHERQLLNVEALQNKVDSLNCAKAQSDKCIADLRAILVERGKENEALSNRVLELQKDVNEATLIIAQKTKAQDEIGKDLVQANTMLVNFNNQFNLMAKELDTLKEMVASKEKTIQDQCTNLQKFSADFSQYKLKYNEENIKQLNHELFLSSQRLKELEKQNREAAKINGLLTKKLANDNASGSWNVHCSQLK